MLTDLIERDNEERLRVSSRSLEFPDGETRRIETYRLVWRWFDHLIAERGGCYEDENRAELGGGMVLMKEALHRLTSCARHAVEFS